MQSYLISTEAGRHDYAQCSVAQTVFHWSFAVCNQNKHLLCCLVSMTTSDHGHRVSP